MTNNLRNACILVLMLSLLGLSPCVLAQVYMGGVFGMSDTQSSEETVPDMESDLGFRLSLGNQLSDTLSLEVAYVDLGSFEVGTVDGVPDETESSDTLDISGYEVAVVGKWPLPRNIALFARLGVFAWDGERVIVSAEDGQSASILSSSEDVSLGVGVDMQLMNHLGIVLEANQFKTGDAFSQLYGIGVYFTF